MQMQNPISDLMTSPRPGFRFHPTDDELLMDYLKRKILGQPEDLIPEIDVLKLEPGELQSTFGDEKLYFFCQLKRKYASSDRWDRTAKGGYWKQSSRGCEIMGKRLDELRGKLIGKRNTLVFHAGSMRKGTRTSWTIHEFHLNRQCLDDARDGSVALDYVLCRIMNNKDKKAKRGHAPTPVNQEGDCLSFRDNQHNEVAAAPREMSQPLDGILLDANTTTAFQPQAGEVQGSSSLFGCSGGNDGIGLDREPLQAPDGNLTFSINLCPNCDLHGFPSACNCGRL